jgi:hypothetical protein
MCVSIRARCVCAQVTGPVHRRHCDHSQPPPLRPQSAAATTTTVKPPPLRPKSAAATTTTVTVSKPKSWSPYTKVLVFLPKKTLTNGTRPPILQPALPPPPFFLRHAPFFSPGTPAGGLKCMMRTMRTRRSFPCRGGGGRGGMLRKPRHACTAPTTMTCVCMT